MIKKIANMKLKIAITERPCLERPNPRTPNLKKKLKLFYFD